MSGELRIGLIGCGAMGQGHLGVWAQTPGARIAAVCDGVVPRAQETARRLGARPYATLPDMIEAGGLDAVDICTPSGLHADQALLAAQSGLHILCEKPLDLRIEKVDRLIEACEARGLTLACIFQRRAYRGAQQIARLVVDGRLGRILSCSAAVKWWRTQDYYDSSAWRGTRAMDGGVLANQAIHALDHLCWLCGPVAEVEYACLETIAHRMEAEDFAIAALRFENGARGIMEATTCCSPDLCTRLELFGSRGSVAFEDATVVRFGLDGEDHLADIEQDDDRIGGGSIPMAINLRGHAVLLKDFVEAVRDGRPPLVGGRDARLSVQVLDMIYRKACSVA